MFIQVKDNITKSQAKQQKNDDNKLKVKTHTFSTGDSVLQRMSKRKFGSMHNIWSGPYTITHISKNMVLGKTLSHVHTF